MTTLYIRADVQGIIRRRRLSYLDQAKVMRKHNNNYQAIIYDAKAAALLALGYELVDQEHSSISQNPTPGPSQEPATRPTPES